VRLPGSKAAPLTSSGIDAFWVMWIPTLLVGFISGYLFHAFLDWFSNSGPGN
jgi:hypothetical protein